MKWNHAHHATLLVALVTVFCCTASLQAGAIPTFGVFELLDHPDAALTATQGPYGLRLDSGDPPPGAGPTFSVEIPAGVVTLTWPLFSTTATIEGVVHNNTTNQEWEVEYDITGITQVADGFVASGGSGTLTALAPADPGSDPMGTVIPLTSEQNGDGNAFLFLADGHRLDNDDMTTVGRGWFDADDTNDWILIGVQIREFVIPEPTTALLATIALAMAAPRRRV